MDNQYPQPLQPIDHRRILFDVFLEKAPAAIAMFDTKMRYLLASKRWYEDYKLDNSILGKSHYEVFPNISEEWKEIHKQCLQGESASSDEDTFEVNGQKAWMKWEIVPWYKESGEIGGIIMFTENITHIKSSQAELMKRNEELEKMKMATLNILEDVEIEKNKASEDREKYSLILAGIADGVVALNPEREVILANPTACDLLGLTVDEVMGKKVDEVLKIENSQGKQLNEFIDSVYHDSRIVNTPNDSYLISTTGEKTAVSGSSSPLNINNEVRGCIVVLRDSSRERKIDQMKSDFVSIASHQLRTPLTAIKWYVELLGAEVGSNAELSELVNEISESNQRMITLVNDLLSVSRIEKDASADLEKSEFKLLTLLEEVVKQNQSSSKQRKVTIEVQIGPDITITADYDKLFEVFNNLINNAIKYSKPETQITVSCTLDENSIEIIVEDQGIGIPADQQNKIFTKFFRADNAKSQETEGNGLGLYIAQSLIESHAGTIRLESELNIGTKFIINLPK